MFIKTKWKWSQVMANKLYKTAFKLSMLKFIYYYGSQQNFHSLFLTHLFLIHTPPFCLTPKIFDQSNLILHLVYVNLLLFINIVICWIFSSSVLINGIKFYLILSLSSIFWSFYLLKCTIANYPKGIFQVSLTDQSNLFSQNLEFGRWQVPHWMQKDG